MTLKPRSPLYLDSQLKPMPIQLQLGTKFKWIHPSSPMETKYCYYHQQLANLIHILHQPSRITLNWKIFVRPKYKHVLKRNIRNQQKEITTWHTFSTSCQVIHKQKVQVCVCVSFSMRFFCSQSINELGFCRYIQTSKLLQGICGEESAMLKACASRVTCVV